MPIYKKKNKNGNVWVVRIFIGRDENGKQKFHKKIIEGTKKKAIAYETKKLRERDLGISIESTNTNLNKYLDEWLDKAAKHRLRERTFEDYKEYLKRYVRDVIGSKKLCDLKPLDIQKLYTDLLECNLSARTVRYCHAVLSSALKQAVKWQILVVNPCDAVDLPKQQRTEMNCLSPEEATKFLKAAKADKWYVIFSLALATGMRPEEYLGLQWKDLNFDAGTIMVRRALVWKRKGGGWSLQEPKTPQSRRTIPLPVSILKELKEHRRKQNEGRLLAGAEYQNDDFIFAGEFGNPIMASNLFRRHFQPIINKMVEEGKLKKKIRLYDLRHSCATLLLSAGENPKVVSERLGHASITLTLDVYSHVLPDMQKSATEKIEKMLFGT